MVDSAHSVSPIHSHMTHSVYSLPQTPNHLFYTTSQPLQHPRNFHSPCQHPPTPSEIYQHYPPNQPHFIPTNQFAPLPPAYEQQRPISLAPARVHETQMDPRILEMQDSFEAIRARQSSFRAEILEELGQLHLGPKAPVTESASSLLKFGSLPAGSVTHTVANGSSSTLSTSSRGILISEKPNLNLSPHEVTLGLNKDFTTAFVNGNHSKPTTTAVMTEELALNVDKNIARGFTRVKFSDSYGSDVANSIVWRNDAQTHCFQHTSFRDGSSAGYGELVSHNHNSVGNIRVDFHEREEKELEDAYGEDDNEDEGKNDNTESYGDGESYSDDFHSVNGQIVTDSDEEVVTDDEGSRLCIKKEALLETMYQSKDPKSLDEAEMLENLFNCLCGLLMPLENRDINAGIKGETSRRDVGDSSLGAVSLDQHRDIASIAMKAMVAEVSTQSLAQSILGSILPQSIKGSTARGMNTEIKCEYPDILCYALHKFGNIMPTDHELLLGALLSQLSSNQKNVGKKSVSCIASLASSLSDDLLAKATARVVQHLSNKGTKYKMTQTSLSQVFTTLNFNYQDVRRAFESFVFAMIKVYNHSLLNSEVEEENWPHDDRIEKMNGDVDKLFDNWSTGETNLDSFLVAAGLAYDTDLIDMAPLGSSEMVNRGLNNRQIFTSLSLMEILLSRVFRVETDEKNQGSVRRWLICCLLLCDCKKKVPTLAGNLYSWLNGDILCLLLENKLEKMSLLFADKFEQMEGNARMKFDDIWGRWKSIVIAAIKYCTEDDSMFNDNQGTPELPDGLVYFRTALVELLVDNCQLLRSTTFVQKCFSGGWASAIAPISWKDVEIKLFALNVVAEVILQKSQIFDFSSYLDDNLDTFAHDLGDNSLVALHCIDTTVVEMLKTSVVGWLHLILCLLTHGLNDWKRSRGYHVVLSLQHLMIQLFMFTAWPGAIIVAVLAILTFELEVKLQVKRGGVVRTPIPIGLTMTTQPILMTRY